MTTYASDGANFFKEYKHSDGKIKGNFILQRDMGPPWGSVKN